MEGLKHKYNLTKADGREVDPDGIYFILKLNSKNAAHRNASQEAALMYADFIKEAIPPLAQDLKTLVGTLRENESAVSSG